MNWSKGVTVAAVAALLFAGAAAFRPAPAARAQGADPTAHTITVVGTAQQSVTPDIAHVTLGVRSHGTTAEASQKANDKASQALIAAIEAAGVKADDIQTVGYNLQPHYQPGGPDTPPKISGFDTTQSLDVTVHDITQVGAIVDAAVAAGANQVENIAYGVANPGQVEQQSYAAAIKDARARADAIASSLGVSISGVYSADVTGTSGGGPLPFGRLATAVPSAAPSTPLQPGKQTIDTQVKVVYTFTG